MLHNIFSKIKRIFIKKKKIENENDKIFSINWFVTYIPPVITTKNEFDRFILTAKYIKQYSQKDIVNNTKNFNDTQIRILLDLINGALESFLQYEHKIIHDMSKMVHDNEKYLADDTKKALGDYGIKRYQTVVETLKAYRDLSLLLFMNKRGN